MKRGDWRTAKVGKRHSKKQYRQPRKPTRYPMTHPVCLSHANHFRMQKSLSLGKTRGYMGMGKKKKKKGKKEVNSCLSFSFLFLFFFYTKEKDMMMDVLTLSHLQVSVHCPKYLLRGRGRYITGRYPGFPQCWNCPMPRSQKESENRQRLGNSANGRLGYQSVCGACIRGHRSAVTVLRIAGLAAGRVSLTWGLGSRGLSLMSLSLPHKRRSSLAKRRHEPAVVIRMRTDGYHSLGTKTGTRTAQPRPVGGG
ncbi:hypothetical protein QBC44DRAFT_33996 [Cladorrhinum sp. PSN332]|nr:hypothetical protein QBC44DRAFT_33996 [Cladorrhinum sp. PSN332]